MDKAQGKKITITTDGPYEVSGNVPLQQDIIDCDAKGNSVGWKKGKEYQSEEEPYHLCRCGHSHTKPYCDGSHDDVGFCGREHANRPLYQHHASVQRGEKVDLLDDQSLCIGARFCDRGKSVWGYVDASGDPENVRKAVQEACDCPSGRLTVVDKEGRGYEPKLEPGIGLIQDPINDCRGPLWVKGGIQVEGAEGEKYEVRNRVALCRCGESKNQPFCDGSHYNCQHMLGSDE